MRIILDLRLIPFLILYLLMSIILLIVHIIRSKKGKTKYTLFFKEMVLLYSLMLFKFAFLGFQITDTRGYNIMLENGLLDNVQFIQPIPFKTIRYVLSISDGLDIYSIQIIGNILLILPIAVLFNYIKNFSIKKTLLYSFGFVLFIETYQLVIDLITKIPSRTFDIDDFILNMIGVVIGIIISTLIKRHKNINSFVNRICYSHDENTKNNHISL